MKIINIENALAHFNKDKHQWYGWVDIDGEKNYSNLKLNDDTAVMPTEEEVNAKIAELQWEQNRRNGYPALGEQFDKLWHDINNGTLDETGEFFTALKSVKDQFPKP